METSAAHIERLFAAGQHWATIVNTREINAVTGPVYVTGAEPGDALAVEILEIETLDWGWNMWLPGFGLLGQRATLPQLRRISIRDDRVWLTSDVSVPPRPMIGCLGVAPATGESSTLAPPYPWAGNYDLPQICAGSTVLFPVQVPGALFSLGDLHAAMGTGEPTSVAIECSGAAVVRFGLRKGLELSAPRIETLERIYTIGISDRRDYSIAASLATDQMFRILVDEAGYSLEDSYVIFSAAVDLEFGGPAAAVVLSSISRDLVEI
jgi:amidase